MTLGKSFNLSRLYSISIYYVPGSMLSNEVTDTSKKDNPCPQKAYILMGEDNGGGERRKEGVFLCRSMVVKSIKSEISRRGLETGQPGLARRMEVLGRTHQWEKGVVGVEGWLMVGRSQRLREL